MRFWICSTILLLWVHDVHTTDCGTCTTTYEGAPKGTDKQRCDALTAYMVCLEDGDTNCPLPAAKAAALKTAYDNRPASCSFSDVCICQFSYHATDLATDNTASQCPADKALFACLKDASGTSCNSKTRDVLANKHTLAANCGTPTCKCVATYLKTANKCDGQKVLADCLKSKSEASCDSTTSSQEATALLETSCTNTFTDTCKCEAEFAKKDISTAKCNADKAYFACLKTATGVSCVGDKTANALATAYTPDTSCASDTCKCVITYLKVDRTQNTAKCNAQKVLADCLKGKTETSCDTNKSSQEATALLESSCTDTFTGTCKCEAELAKKDLSTAKCNADKAYFACLKTATGVSCVGDKTANALATAYTPDTSCATETCKCVITYLKIDRTDNTNKCNGQKVLADCLKGKAEASCDSTKSSQEATALLESSCTDTFTGTCKCEAELAKKDLSTAKCNADKAYFVCLKTATGVSCVGDKTANALATAYTPDTSCATDTCKCVITYLRADRADNTKKCNAQKVLANCLKGNADEASCDSTKSSAEATALLEKSCTDTFTSTCQCVITYVKAARSQTNGKCSAQSDLADCLKGKAEASCDSTKKSHQEATTLLETSCTDTFTDTCKCEAELAKMDVDAAKCESYKSFLSCMKTTTGVSCVGSKTATVVVEDAEGVLNGINNCDVSDTCRCEIAYAKNNIADAGTKCTADKALVDCLISKTATGCKASTTVESLVTLASKDIGKANCAKTTSCGCEMDYAKGEKTKTDGHCSNAKKLFSCLYDQANDQQTCGSTKSSRQDFAKNLITSTLQGCSLDDTCKCEENLAAGGCDELKAGITCLSKASSKGCNGQKTVKTLADDVARKIAAKTNPVCSLSKACQCEQTYTKQDVSDDAKKCKAGKDLRDCLNKVKSESSGVDVKGCDDKTPTSTILKDVAQKVIDDKCGAVSCSSASISLMLVLSVFAKLMF